MRRGRDGWRSDTPRAFRPRAGGFRPPRPQGLHSLGPPRFPHYYHHSRSPYNEPNHHHRNYSYQNPRFNQGHQNTHHQSNYASHNIPESSDSGPQSQFHNQPYSHTRKRQPYEKNLHNNINYNHSAYHFKNYPPERNHHANLVGGDKNLPHSGDGTQCSGNTEINQTADVSRHSNYGLRPHSSDYFEGNAVPSDDSETFSRSVGDTVNIIRERLLNRHDSSSEPLPAPSQPYDYVDGDNSQMEQNIKMQESNLKKKSLKSCPQVIKTNCHKIKSKIVDQLFKMDKDTIHKLMDNPNSSSKFEYAINSLITESQNSLKRHARAAADKSFYAGDDEHFKYKESDTIYEDTFMKQMQCVLDPHDSIILSDIKPIVMAELNKVLQLDEMDLQTDMGNEFETQQNAKTFIDNHLYNKAIHTNITEDYLNEDIDYNTYADQKPHSSHDYLDMKTSKSNHDNEMYDVDEIYGDMDDDYSKLDNTKCPKPIFHYDSEKRISADKRRNSIIIKDESVDAENANHVNSVPLFNSGIEPLSVDEDPFAELDKQYHVDVDPNFIKVDDTMIESKSMLLENNIVKELPQKNHQANEYNVNDYDSNKVSTNMSDSCSSRKNKVSECESEKFIIKEEPLNTVQTSSDVLQVPHELPRANVVPLKEKKSKESGIKKSLLVSKDKDVKSKNLTDKSATVNSRKRPIDEQPSHRKEKKKKRDLYESNKKIVTENIIINLDDFPSKSNDNCESKPIFNSHHPKGDLSNNKIESKQTGTIDISYSDKYVKRKDTLIQTNNDNSNKKPKSSTTYSPTKLENKSKLKTIDMFEQKMRKVQLHQTPRNTAALPETITSLVSTNHKKIEEHIMKEKEKKSCKSVSTQIIRRIANKETQTVTNKINALTVRNKCIQTDDVTKKKPNSGNTLERMKEIDLEIQILLQEKFTLYNSMEKEVASQATITNFGMAVLNVTPTGKKINNILNENTLPTDTTIEDFTSLSEEQLEKILLEGVNNSGKIFEDANQTPKSVNKCAPKKMTHWKSKKKSQQVKEKIQDNTDDDTTVSNEGSLPIPDSSSPSPRKTRSKKGNQISPRKRKRKNLSKSLDLYGVKPCSVVLIKIDANELFANKSNNSNSTVVSLDNIIEETEYVVYNDEGANIEITEDNSMEATLIENLSLIDDINFQDDMMYISEDIVIDGDCEIDKSTEEIKLTDKDCLSVTDNSVNEPCDDEIYSNTENATNICKVYDFSSDDELRKDCTSVTGCGDAILAIECVRNNFLASSLDGNVYYFNNDGQLITTLRGSNFAVTCMCIVEDKYNTTVYTGSLDSRIRYYDLESGLERGPECNVLSPIQSMDRAWDTIFVGTRTGFVLQFECKNNMLIPVSTIKFSEQSILSLKALKEGPRKVLLLASRSENVTIKDAQTGLLLRSLVGPKMTVYSLLYESGKIYCGTSSNNIQVFDYASGSYISGHEGGKGAVCLRAAGGLVFAGCYDGCVYVFRSGERDPIAQLKGANVMLLSLATVGTKVIAGFKDRSLFIWKMPMDILKEMIL